ncbi:MAG: 30S ribosomal protein S3ae [Nitrososphaerota archaeon]|nr:30S ribosomal protein S3ae [Nitrososphaerota archaeon]MDG7048678.1 30S ribosomal protein S3ae [Nitrososphaerota archaeon]MDG7050912.1 30S ribosomal protein S3ae [Nitrososphaerota archaeon]
MPKVVKVKDKWKAKTWLSVFSASVFGNIPIASIPVNEPGNAVGRVVSSSLYDLFKDDPANNNIKLYFQIDKVEGDKAFTHVKRIEYVHEFLRGLIRRGSSIVELIKDYHTVDGVKVRIYVNVFTQKTINTSKKHDIRKGVDLALSSKVPSISFDQLVQIAITGKLAESIGENIKKIERIKHVGIGKLKVLGALPAMEDFNKATPSTQQPTTGEPISSSPTTSPSETSSNTQQEK